ncbi:MAG: hypothetical protein KUL76_10245 [Kaistella sp.]|nr:hypothetical protein [Kaistella sp.]
MEPNNIENRNGKWIWGIFYYNKEDDRIFPPKRFPWMGWTVNFANWKSIAALVAMLIFFYFIVFMIEKNK